jgi:heme oxygenase
VRVGRARVWNFLTRVWCLLRPRWYIATPHVSSRLSSAASTHYLDYAGKRRKRSVCYGQRPPASVSSWRDQCRDTVRLFAPPHSALGPAARRILTALASNLHTTLNRLITSRLPLALPPHAADPSLYTTGLLHFAHVFLTFESLWADLLRDYSSHDAAPASPPMSPLLSYLLVNPYDSPALFTSTLGAPTPPSPQLLAFLQTLRPRGLIRSARVKRDLACLMDLHPTDLDVLLAKYPGDKVADFCTHIRKTVHEKPWTLVSYAWCFYMAVFSGGRWIRAGLLQAGPDFWHADSDGNKTPAAPLPECGLSFWHFQGPYDGEDIKVEFKTQLSAAETLLTTDQRVDIIEEAKNVFQLCASLVQELDDMVGPKLNEAALKDEHGAQSMPSLAPEPIRSTAAKGQPQVTTLSSPNRQFSRFVRKPDVTGTLVALACLACVILMRYQ